ncbi:class I SAM-dependent methyltransferase [Patescibacteria group bacterium]|nr:class I SAM-dependent methyltransferase [Patescibacteria group bacterium]
MTNEEALDVVFNFIHPSILEQLKAEGAYTDILSGKIKTGAEVYDYIDEQHASLQDADYTSLVNTLKADFNAGSLLQIGCGRGDFLLRCANIGHSPIYGIDRSSVMLDEAKYKLRNNQNANLYLEKIENFDFSKLNEINNVILNNFWGMVDEKSSIDLLNNIKKCLTPDAKIFIGTYSDNAISPQRQKADITLKNNLNFLFSFGFFKDFDQCRYDSKTIDIGNEKYFILTLKP